MTVLSALSSCRIPAPGNLDADTTISLYEALRPLLPAAPQRAVKKSARLADIISEFDALILDGFGVINVGTEKIDAIDEIISLAGGRNMPVLVLTNGASHPADRVAEKYKKWGLALDTGNVLSSRDALAQFAAARPETGNWICIDDTVTPLAGRPVAADGRAAALDAADGIIMLGSSGWTEADQAVLEQALLKRPRPVLVGNPDISAPHHDGFSAEPGYWMARAIQRTDIRPLWFGKPHAPAFQLAYDRLTALSGRIMDKQRIAMVGDSLHTDILGGNAFGLATILVTGYGLLREHDADRVIAATQITPTWQVERL